MASMDFTVELSSDDFTKSYVFGAIKHIKVGIVSCITVFDKPIYWRCDDLWQFLWLRIR